MFPLWIVGRRSPVGESGRSSRKLVSALGATGLQNGAARTGLHTMAKAVLLGTTAIIWLESAFHARLLGSVSTTLDEQPIGLNDGTTTARTLQAKLGFLCLWKTCYLRFPRLVSAGVSTPCG